MPSATSFLGLLTTLTALSAQSVLARVANEPRQENAQCRKTSVAILGAGVAGITAAQALSNSSISDFVIIEYRDKIGGRLIKTDFGAQQDGKPYTIEYGANWVHGLGKPGGRENPIWTMAKKYNLKNQPSNYSSIMTFNETGATDFTNIIEDFEHVSKTAGIEAGRLLAENLQDQSARSGLALAGWRPKPNDMKSQAVEFWQWDWNGCFTPDTSSLIFGVAGENLTYSQFSDENNLSIDQRGFATILEGEAATFLKPNDDRLLLNTEVTNITWSDDGVTVHNKDGSCVSAAYAVITFSIGVLQNHGIGFKPELPKWKKTSIEKFSMGTYTKVFYQFNETFWPENVEYFLYADNTTRGHWPIWQSLNVDGFVPGSNILFATMTNEESYRIERQSDEETKQEGLRVLRKMFPDKTIPEPTAFTFPRWNKWRWTYGSYSNWPIGTTLEMHQNLRANAGRLWFAGEATSAPYFGFLHGAWYEGRETGAQIAALMQNRCARVYDGIEQCGARASYSKLHGTSPLDHYNLVNGWAASSLEESKKRR